MKHHKLLNTIAAWACGAIGLLISVYLIIDAMPDKPEAVVVDSERKHLGELRQGEEESVTYTITNNTSHDCMITNVMTSCGCAVAEISDKLLSPDESAEIEATIKTGRARDAVVSSITVLYKLEGEDASKAIFLLCMADIKPHYTIVPQQLVFHKGVPETTEVVLTSQYAPYVIIKEARCTDPAFTTVVENEVNSNICRIRITYDPEMEEQNQDATSPPLLLITTDSERQETHDVQMIVVQQESETFNQDL
jgi:hypothetical protein